MKYRFYADPKYMSGQTLTFSFLKYKLLNHIYGLTWKNNLANIFIKHLLWPGYRAQCEEQSPSELDVDSAFQSDSKIKY